MFTLDLIIARLKRLAGNIGNQAVLHKRNAQLKVVIFTHLHVKELS